jgi:hypothetical protein
MDLRRVSRLFERTVVSEASERGWARVNKGQATHLGWLARGGGSGFNTA